MAFIALRDGVWRLISAICQQTAFRFLRMKWRHTFALSKRVSGTGRNRASVAAVMSSRHLCCKGNGKEGGHKVKIE